MKVRVKVDGTAIECREMSRLALMMAVRLYRRDARREGYKVKFEREK